jgi:hypothetical protein
MLLGQTWAESSHRLLGRDQLLGRTSPAVVSGRSRSLGSNRARVSLDQSSSRSLGPKSAHRLGVELTWPTRTKTEAEETDVGMRSDVGGLGGRGSGDAEAGSRRQQGR